MATGEVAAETGELAFPAGDAQTLVAEAAEALHDLERKWTFWFDNESKKQGAAWGTSLRRLYTFDTIEEFWCFYDQIFKPRKSTVNADFHLFRTGVEPK